MHPNRGAATTTPQRRSRFRGERTGRRTGWWSAAVGVVVRPWLWWTALRQLARMSRPGWWKRPPFLPLPDPAYARFRLETAYGPDGKLRSEDLVSYLEWCRHAH
jgi:hypothetical protein